MTEETAEASGDSSVASPDSEAAVALGSNGAAVVDAAVASGESTAAWQDQGKDVSSKMMMGRNSSTQDPSRKNLNGSTPGGVLRGRERKWIDMIKNWDKVMKHKPEKVKKRCRKGIPQSIRPKAWMLLSGAEHLKKKNPRRFEELAAGEVDEKVMEQIRKDLHRTLPKFEMFKSPQGQGQADLLKILKSYAVHNPAIGYTQAMSDIAGSLLTVMPAEDAFWVFVAIIDNYLPNYFADGMVPLLNDADIFDDLLSETLPDIDDHLKLLGIPSLTYLPPWFLCIFTRTLEWSCVLRVLDMFFFEGIKVLFRVAASILQLTLGSPSQREKYQWSVW
eukprot:scpid55550/ scgid21848/ TBC1 domain family member 10B; Rab27A-GAP-beta